MLYFVKKLKILNSVTKSNDKSGSSITLDNTSVATLAEVKRGSRGAAHAAK